VVVITHNDPALLVKQERDKKIHTAVAIEV